MHPVLTIDGLQSVCGIDECVEKIVVSEYSRGLTCYDPNGDLCWSKSSGKKIVTESPRICGDLVINPSNPQIEILNLDDGKHHAVLTDGKGTDLGIKDRDTYRSYIGASNKDSVVWTLSEEYVLREYSLETGECLKAEPTYSRIVSGLEDKCFCVYLTQVRGGIRQKFPELLPDYDVGFAIVGVDESFPLAQEHGYSLGDHSYMGGYMPCFHGREWLVINTSPFKVFDSDYQLIREIDWVYAGEREGDSDGFITDGKLYFSWKHQVRCYSLADGKLVWESASLEDIQTSGFRGYRTLTLITDYLDYVLCWSGAGQFVLLDKNTGDVAQRFTVDYFGNIRNVVVKNERVWVCCDKGLVGLTLD